MFQENTIPKIVKDLNLNGDGYGLILCLTSITIM